MRVRTVPSSSVSHTVPTKSAGASGTAPGTSGRRALADRRRGLLQVKPVEGVGAEAQEIRLIADTRELRLAEHLDRHHAAEA